MEYSSKGTKKVKDSNDKNKQLDKFYTNDSAVDGLIELLVRVFKNDDKDLDGFTFLEPCAGGGAFLNGVERHFPKSKVISYDIEPEDKRIQKANFLEIEPKYNKKLITIGNPPFGYKGDLAAAFIDKCSEWGDVVAFVLPIQFRRYNIQKRVNPNMKLVYSSEDLPKKSFLLNGKPYNVNCMYQIWVRKDSKYLTKLEDIRMYEPLPNKHPDFKLFIHNNTVETLKYFDKSVYKWDFAVYRQGFYDYKQRIVDEKKLEKHIQYLFVKYINPVSRTVFDHLDFEKLSHTNTSILGYSNTDVVAEYVRIKKELGFKDEEKAPEQLSLFDSLPENKC